MTFSVTYRGADGAVRTEAVEAASRADCLSQMRARGVAVLGVKSGGRARAVKRDVKDKRDVRDSGKPIVPYVLFVALVSLAVVGVWWWLARVPETATLPEPEAPKKPSALPKEVKPAAAPKAIPAPSTNSASASNSAASATSAVTNNPYNGVWRGQKIVSYTIKTNGWSTYERIITEDGKSHGVIGTTVKPVFDNGSDQMLALAVRASKDTEMPPMPFSPLMESDFLASLKKPIVINDDDSEEVKQLKRDVMQARENMIDLVNKGMTVQGALEEHFRLSNENVGIRNKAVDELRAILDSGDAEGAAKYLEAVNPTLERMGIMKLELPEERVKGRKRRAAAEADTKAE